MDINALIKEAGPYTAPLCLAMGAAIGWLLKELATARRETREAREDATQLREKRATDLERAAREYAEAGEANRNSMREWTTAAEAVLARM